MARPERVPQSGAIWSVLRELDDAFVSAAAGFGFEVLREPGAYVSYQGDSIIRVAPYADLDPDDTLGQMIIHELCHHFVEGEPSREQWDWGLSNIGDDDEPSELAAIRTQAALLDAFGLRCEFAPTTDFRFEYDALGSPFEGDAKICERARSGLIRMQSHPGFAELRALLERAQELSAS